MRVRFIEGTRPSANPGLRGRVERRLRLVVGRRAPSIVSVEVSLESLVAADASSPSARHRCRIHARLVSGGSVEVEEFGTDVEHAIDVAAWRLDRRLERMGRWEPSSGPAF
jgi:ribosome-associated translation inhibitor RaiA